MSTFTNSLTPQAPLIRDWTDYYNAVAGRPPRETLRLALDQFDQDLLPTHQAPFAVDLGCGEGRDTIELVRRGWHVFAIDGEQTAIERLLERPDLDTTYLKTRVDRFESLSLPESVDLINASYCLPFCPPADFPTLWQKITNALRPGGRFCGQLFGDRDSWAIYPNMTHHSRPQVENLLSPFAVESLDEEEHPGTTALGEEKHWHIFNIVACKLDTVVTPSLS